MTSRCPCLSQLLVIASATIIHGCGGDSTDSTEQPFEPEVPRVTDVRVSPTGFVFGALRDTMRFTATVTDQSVQVVSGAHPTWYISDELVAAIDPDGLVTAWDRGEARVVATVEDVADTAHIFVLPVRWDTLVAGHQHTCARGSRGDTYCWGNGASLGIGAEWNGRYSTPLLMSGELVFSTLSAGRFHTCGLTPDGKARCWGHNWRGEIGDGTTEHRGFPTEVSGGLVFSAINAGGEHTCGITSTGDGYCWGANGSGQVGDGTTIHRHIPTRLSGALRWATISAGRYHACGVTEVGEAWCWGTNGGGKLGIGPQLDRSLTPLRVPASVAWGTISSSETHTCGVDRTGRAWCWGANEKGELGDGTTIMRFIPVEVLGGLRFLTIEARKNVTCGITIGVREAYCWGDNSSGLVGDGSTVDRHVPTKVAGGRTWSSLDVGYYHVCGISSLNDAYCWGRNWSGQLGIGTIEFEESIQVPTKTVNPIQDLSRSQIR